MERKYFWRTLLTFVFLMNLSSANAQFVTWAKQIGGPWLEYLNSIKFTTEGDIITCGYVGANAIFQDTVVATTFIGTTTNGNIPYLAKYNSNGRLDWVITPTQVNGGNGQLNDIEILSNGDIIAVGQYGNSFAFGSTILPQAGGSGFVIKVDPFGNIKWCKDFNAQTVTPERCAKINDNSILISGRYANSLSLGGTSFNDSGFNLFVSEIDSSGNWQGLMSSTTPASNWQVFVKSMEVNSQGDVHLAGGLYGGDFTFAGGNVDVFYNSGSTVAESFLFKFNFNNQTLDWSKQFGCSCNGSSINDISLDTTNNTLYGVGYFENTISIDGTNLISNGSTDGFVFSIDANSNYNWIQKIGGTQIDLPQSVLVYGDNSIAVYGEYSLNITASGVAVNTGNNNIDGLLKFNQNGLLLGYKFFDASDNDIISPFSSNSFAYSKSTNQFILSSYFGQSVSFDFGSYTSFGIGDILLYGFWDGVCETDNKIKGFVFIDSNSNCVKDSGEFPLKNSVVACMPGPSYAITDSTGYFEICVDTGTYTLTNTPLVEQWIPSCQDTILFQSNYNTTNLVYFGYEPGAGCPKLKVDVSSIGVFRRCQNIKYKIEATNIGTLVQNSAYLNVTLPSSLIYSGSNISNTVVNGNNVFLPLGNINPGQIINAEIDASVYCLAQVGSTQCFEVRLLPDTACTSVDSSYDRRNITIVGECLQNDSAKFTIRNVNTQNPYVYQGFTKMYFNNALFRTDTFSLAPGDSMILIQDVNNATVRCELHFIANQYPAYNGTQVTLTDCDNPTGIGWNGVNALPQFDNDLNYEVKCDVIVGPYDPNDKTASPVGITNNHYLGSREIIEYQINFQNVGSDTAFNVLIVDTLSQNLDITTLQLGPCSHPYSFSIVNGNILNWYFPYILLPDSTTNFLGSCGQVNFKIRTLNGLTPNTQIFNSAAIYFDFNEPIITNEVFHTIYDTTIVISSLPESFNSQTLRLYPNPVSEILKVDFDNSEKRTNFNCNIIDVLGKSVKTITDLNDDFYINVSDLAPGIYILEIDNGINRHSVKFIRK